MCLSFGAAARRETPLLRDLFEEGLKSTRGVKLFRRQGQEVHGSLISVVAMAALLSRVRSMRGRRGSEVYTSLTCGVASRSSLTRN
ncbi:hypothetical protein SSAG_02706 [Streptomyces sp. Mg1]|nr:hypothetical protein SSAG_02706 [Streptomyces sp. Mg1]